MAQFQTNCAGRRPASSNPPDNPSLFRVALPRGPSSPICVVGRPWFPYSAAGFASRRFRAVPTAGRRRAERSVTTRVLPPGRPAVCGSQEPHRGETGEGGALVVTLRSARRRFVAGTELRQNPYGDWTFCVRGPLALWAPTIGALAGHWRGDVTPVALQRGCTRGSAGERGYPTADRIVSYGWVGPAKLRTPSEARERTQRLS